MGNIYIEVDENFRVTKVHRMPFDPNNGMGYTREELEKKGFFINEIPEPVHQVGRRSVMMYNPDMKSVYYEHVGIPMSDKERLNQIENAMNWMIQSSYGNLPMNNEDGKKNTLSDGIDSVGEYLAYQIISGKLDYEDCIKNCPECEQTIRDVLAENGIQV